MLRRSGVKARGDTPTAVALLRGETRGQSSSSGKGVCSANGVCSEEGPNGRRVEESRRWRHRVGEEECVQALVEASLQVAHEAAAALATRTDETRERSLRVGDCEVGKSLRHAIRVDA